jgi:N-acetylglucosaminyl-diphospho-decaprenol L-rhamnosyltransferase
MYGLRSSGTIRRVTTLAVVIVSWNVRELLRRCLRAVEASLAGSGLAYEILVVDNNSADGSPAMVRERFPQVRLIEPGANLGFSGGNNAALRALAARGWPDYVLLLNPDAEPLHDAVPRLVGALEARPELVAAGPQLLYGDGTHQPSRRRFPTRATLFWESTLLDRLWPANPWARRYRMADQPHDRAQPVGWLVGAALLVRGSAIAAAGLLDERFFLYSEELEWQWRLQLADCSSQIEPGRMPRESRIWYVPEAIVLHHEGQSSGQVAARRLLIFNRSRLLLARIWFGWRFAALLRRFLRLGLRYELLAESAKLLAGHKARLRRERIAVYWQLLRDL